jgi:hypothetical protein
VLEKPTELPTNLADPRPQAYFLTRTGKGAARDPTRRIQTSFRPADLDAVAAKELAAV